MSDVDGRYIVGRHWHRWSVQDQSWNPPKTLSLHDTCEQAQAAAARLNTPRRAQQASLFDTQEAAN